MTVKPFLKWAGGKTQLIPEIQKNLPPNINDKNLIYIEPFVGSGAVLFWVLNNFPNIKRAVINDINTDLINVYKILKEYPITLIKTLKTFEQEYHQLEHSLEEKKSYFNEKKSLFNERMQDANTHAALFIFLNRTCFNGLYRVNRKNFFNVPIGSYKIPLICDENNLLLVHQALQKVDILNGDYEKTLDFAEGNSFFYFDPPYKPLNKTSNFNSYAQDNFNDEEQIRLKSFCTKLNNLGHNWTLSNSDVEEYFDELYKEFDIKRVLARRNINSNSNNRGKITEVLIKNYSNMFKQI